MEHRITSRDVWVVLANTILALILVALLWQLRTLVSWVLASLVLALAAEPIVQALMRHRLKRGWAVLVVCLGFLALLAGMVATLVPMVIEQAQALIESAPDLLARLQQTAPFQWVDRRVDVLGRIQTALAESGAGAAGPALDVASTIVRGVVGVITIVILAVFAMLYGGSVFRGALEWMPPDRREHWSHLGDRMKTAVGRYFLGTLLVASIGGLVMGVTTLALGVPYFLALALLMTMLGLVPYIGSAIAAVVVVGITFSAEGLTAGLIALGVYLVYQQIENEVLQPIVQKRTMRMNPLVISIALLAGTMLAGILGALLALPVAGAIEVLVQDLQAQRARKWAPVEPGPGADAREPRGSAETQRDPAEPASAPT